VLGRLWKRNSLRHLRLLFFSFFFLFPPALSHHLGLRLRLGDGMSSSVFSSNNKRNTRPSELSLRQGKCEYGLLSYLKRCVSHCQRSMSQSASCRFYLLVTCLRCLIFPFIHLATSSHARPSGARTSRKTRRHAGLCIHVCSR
jgi:hypothetical protein